MGFQKHKIKEEHPLAAANRFSPKTTNERSVASNLASSKSLNTRAVQRKSHTAILQKQKSRTHQLKSDLASHEKGCSCPSCCSPLVQSNPTAQLKSASVEVRVSPPPSESGEVLQRTGASVSVGGREKGSHGGLGKGGRPGVTHAEQLAYKAANSPVTGAIEFTVDRPICAACVAWFEKLALTIIQNKGRLSVNVVYQGLDTTVQVTGPGTNWGKASDEGYYKK